MDISNSPENDLQWCLDPAGMEEDKRVVLAHPKRAMLDRSSINTPADGVLTACALAVTFKA